MINSDPDYRIIVSVILLLSLLFSSCNKAADSACDLSFETVTVTVLTPDGEPAESVEITVTENETGEIFDPCEESGTCEALITFRSKTSP